MLPSIVSLIEDTGKMTFTLNNTNVSIANGLRRIVSEVPVVAFKTSPYEEGLCDIEINTTRQNNEIIKQRLSCIPIYTDTSFPVENYVLSIDKQNTGNSILYVTTEDFNVIDLSTGKSEKDIARKLFPPNAITHNLFGTNDYPELARLLPCVTNNLGGNRLKLTCKFSIVSAKQYGTFNVTSTCAYANTPDIDKQRRAWDEKKKNFSGSKEDLAFMYRDWELLDGKRIFLENSFDFTIETVGPISPPDIISSAATLMAEKLAKFQQVIRVRDGNDIISESVSSMPNSYDILLISEDYTLGKVLEYSIYNNNYGKELNFCGFKKPHPHIENSIIRIVFINTVNRQDIIALLVKAAEDAITIYDTIRNVFSRKDNNYAETVKVRSNLSKK